MATKKTTHKPATSELFSDLKASDGSKLRPLNEQEKATLIAMFAIKVSDVSTRWKELRVWLTEDFWLIGTDME